MHLNQLPNRTYQVNRSGVSMGIQLPKGARESEPLAHGGSNNKQEWQLWPKFTTNWVWDLRLIVCRLEFEFQIRNNWALLNLLWLASSLAFHFPFSMSHLGNWICTNRPVFVYLYTQRYEKRISIFKLKRSILLSKSSCINRVITTLEISNVSFLQCGILSDQGETEISVSWGLRSVSLST